uniref:Ig-like domain-containing protein n=1 Tax=Labrus bergylta TaxID=56723 RepID=A0A3Q3E1W0_9LABR
DWLFAIIFLLLSQPLQPQRAGHSLILRLEPNRLQFFEYESLIFHCEGSHDSTGLKIVHRSKGELLKCNTTVTSKRSSCTIPNIFPEDSGQYWCESGDRNRSDIIHINVTADPVILESPISVVEGETVTLRCRRKTTSTNLSADFYKDGRLIRRSSTGNMRIPSVSKHDEGFYKCISGGRESNKHQYTSLMAQLFSVFSFMTFTTTLDLKCQTHFFIWTRSACFS